MIWGGKREKRGGKWGMRGREVGIDGSGSEDRVFPAHPHINVLSKNKKNITIFQLKINIFTVVKNYSILHGRVCIMKAALVMVFSYLIFVTVSFVLSVILTSIPFQMCYNNIY